MNHFVPRGVVVAVQVAMGLWLVISGFLWPHTAEQFLIALFSGLLCCFFALKALGSQRPGYANQLVALWLLVAVVLFPSLTRTTIINHVLVAAVVLIISHLPGREMA